MTEILYTPSGFPYIDAQVYRTASGTMYLKSPGVAMIAMPTVDLGGVQAFLDGWDEGLGFRDYLKDPDQLPDAEQLVKFMGQSCYLSVDANRTWNKDAKKYFDNIRASGHGSVCEHPNFSFYIWGIDRSVTHELVRHRAGFGFSQLSQRYADGSRLRFVERPEYQWDRIVEMVEAAVADDKLTRGEAAILQANVAGLHRDFEFQIDRARDEYERRADTLILCRKHGHPMLQGGARTEQRKMVNQVAREGLPNSTEAPIGVTGNLRAWRHACEMRANSAAEIQIRNAAMMIYRCIREVCPILFDDYVEEALATSGTTAISTATRKV